MVAGSEAATHRDPTLCFYCPRCGRCLGAEASLAGVLKRCPACPEVFVVPSCLAAGPKRLVDLPHRPRCHCLAAPPQARPRATPVRQASAQGARPRPPGGRPPQKPAWQSRPATQLGQRSRRRLRTWWPNSTTGSVTMVLMLLYGFGREIKDSGGVAEAIVAAILWYLFLVGVRYLLVVVPSRGSGT